MSFQIQVEELEVQVRLLTETLKKVTAERDEWKARATRVVQETPGVPPRPMTLRDGQRILQEIEEAGNGT